MKSYDAIIIGGGHNGLVCGAYLAKTGYKTIVLERREILGGASVTEKLWPGYLVNTAAHMLGLMQPKVILDLELQKFGYKALPVPPGVHLIENAGPVVLWKEQDRLCVEFARFSAKDALAYPKYCEHLAKLGPLFQRLMWEIPVDPTRLHLRGLPTLLSFAWRNREILKHFHEVSDLLTMSAEDYLARWFESEEVKTILGYYPVGAAGQSVSTQTPGTAYFLLRSYLRDNNTAAGGTGLAEGGMGSIPAAIAASGARFGLETRTNCEVAQVLIEAGRAVGVVLGDGTIIRAKTVISNAASQHLFTDLISDKTVSQSFKREVSGIHGQSTAFKIHLAVNELPRFAGLQAAGYQKEYPVQVTLAPSLNYMERAYNDMRSGQISAKPFMTIQIPTLVDPSLAPAGEHLLSIYGGHIPSGPDNEHSPEMREHLFNIVMDTIALHAPGFSKHYLHRQIMLSSDYEEIFRLPGGSPHHGDLTLDQLFFRRPVRRYADYSTPVDSLFLCGASTHPGGGVSGVPGHNAAIVVAKALRKYR